MLELVRIPEARQVLDALSAPAVGRHAPARDDRDGAVVPPHAADRRRADHRARRDDPGADPRTHPHPAGGDADGGDLHHARHGRRRRGRRPRRRDVARGTGRGRRDRGDLQGAGASVHARAAGGRAAAAFDERHRPAAEVRAGAGRRRSAGPRARSSAGPRTRPPGAAPLLARARPVHALRHQVGLLRPRRPPRPRGREGELRPRRRRDAGARRRVGLRQVDHRPLAAAPGRHRGRQHRIRRPRHRQARLRGRATGAPRHPVDLPGSLRLARPAAHRRLLDHRAAVRARRGEGPRRRGARALAAAARRALPRTTRSAIRTSSPAASASASPSPARWRSTRRSSSPTRRCPRSTSRSRRRSSTC